MKILEFSEIIVARLRERLGDGFEVVQKKVLKNNSVELDGIVIHEEGKDISPTIYTESFFLEYLNGRSLDNIIEEMLKIHFNSKDFLGNSISSFLNTKEAEDKVVVRLVNYAKNRKMLADSVYDRILDLAVTYHYIMKVGNGETASVRLDKRICELLGLSEDNLRRRAIENTMRMYPPVFETLDETIFKFLQSKDSVNEGSKKEVAAAMMHSGRNSPMYVLSCKNCCNGATGILYDGILERIRKAVGENYYILPSSVNEVLILPESNIDYPSALTDMVRSVNRECVPKQEVLSDRVYHYPEDQFVFPVSVSG